MLVFVAKIQKYDKMYPAISFACPSCKATNQIYTQLRDNECKYCFEKMPFKVNAGRIPKGITSRIDYHVDSNGPF